MAEHGLGDAERERQLRDRRGAIEEHAQGEIRSYHGIVNRWLLAVYVGLTVWAVYYLFAYWGGLGPGLAR